MGNGGHSNNRGIQTNDPQCSTNHTFSRSLHIRREGRLEYIGCRWVSDQADQLKDGQLPCLRVAETVMLSQLRALGSLEAGKTNDRAGS